MKQVIYADGVVTKLQALKDELDNKYGNKKSVDILRKITGRLDDLGRFNSGESTKDRFGNNSLGNAVDMLCSTAFFRA